MGALGWIILSPLFPSPTLLPFPSSAPSCKHLHSSYPLLPPTSYPSPTALSLPPLQLSPPLSYLSNLPSILPSPPFSYFPLPPHPLPFYHHLPSLTCLSFPHLPSLILRPASTFPVLPISVPSVPASYPLPSHPFFLPLFTSCTFLSSPPLLPSLLPLSPSSSLTPYVVCTPAVLVSMLMGRGSARLTKERSMFWFLGGAEVVL